MDNTELLNVLSTGLAQCQIEATETQKQKLLTFLELLRKWNATYNLTAVTEPQEMIPYHILDSLSLLPFLGQEPLLDVGCGGGLPGIPLAILLPNKKLYLLESKQKKTNFLHHVVTSLQLTNVEVVRTRIEDYQPNFLFQEITCRAFASLFDFVQHCARLIAEDGVLIAMKGTKAQIEQETVPTTHFIDDIQPVQVPGLDMERHLVFCRQKV